MRRCRKFYDTSDIAGRNRLVYCFVARTNGKCIKIWSQFTVRRLSSNSTNVLNSMRYFKYSTLTDRNFQ